MPFSKAAKMLRHLRFISKPRILARVANGYARTALLRQDRLRSVELALTYACQARCHKCYAANLVRPGQEYLDVAQVADILSQARALGAIHVNLTGGEPTLRPDLPDIIRACRPDRMVVSMVTNAVSLTRDRLKELRQAGLNTIQISLDSADSTTHDRLRGVPGAYAKVMAAAAWSRELGLNLCFSTVLSTEAESGVQAMLPLLELARREQAFLLICDSASVGGWEGRQDKMMSCQERNDALEQLLRHPQGRHHAMYNFRIKPGCPAGVEKIYITAYGDCTPCDLIHDSAGNAIAEGLAPVWERMRTHPLYRRKLRDCVRYLPEFPDREAF